MKIRNIFLSMLSLAALAVIPTACEEEDGPSGAPSIELSEGTIEFEKAGETKTVKVTATRDWKVDVPSTIDWISVDPKSGKGNGKATDVKITVLANDGMDREASIVFTIGFEDKALTVKQAGTGSLEDLLIYYNDFDKTAAEKTYGTSGTSWPYLDQFDGWQNATGKGAGAENYGYNAMSARNNSNSNGNYSDYDGSGVNNLFFGSSAYFLVQDIALGGNTNIALSFGSEKYLQDGESIFLNSEFHVYLSADAAKWVELTDYTFAGGTTAARWNLANGTFSVPAGTQKISVCFKADVASAYRLDDVRLTVSDKAGTSLDFSKGVEMDFSSNSGGGNTGGETKEPIAATVAEFIAAAESSTQPYKLTGVIGGSINSTYGNFDLTDESGTVYVYGLTKTNLGYGATNDQSYASIGLKAGDKVTLIGFRGSYNGKVEVVYPYYVSHEAGSGSGEEVKEPVTATVADFIAAAESSTQPYQLTGVIGGSINTTYGNFDLTDETGTVYVYGLTKTNLGYGATNDKSYASIGLNAGDKVTLIGFRGSYNGKVEVLYPYYVSHEASGSGFMSLNTTSIDVSASATSATFTIYSNVDWTVASDNADYTVSPASGNGESTVTVSFPANTGDDKVVNITVSTEADVLNKSITLVLTHKKQAQESDGSSLTLSIADNKDWKEGKDDTYGAGYAMEKYGYKLAYYQYESTSKAVAPSADHIRVYKSSVLLINPPSGRKIKKVVLTCTATDKCADMTVLTDNNSTAAANTSAATISWSGSVDSFVAQASSAQVRIKTIAVELE
ncbi:MAG: BACON domain-containing protein [Bacteroidales bacterium]|nr:BACON domain-containing protein [Bacteroidales bacterium]